MSRRTSFALGARDIAPIAVGIVPFGFVAGAAAVEAGFGLSGAVGFSMVVFAGASQLAAIDLLRSGSVVLAVATAWLINLRFLMYSASLAPYVAHEPPRRRLTIAYLLTDQSYALSVTRFAEDRDTTGRFAYYLGTAVPLYLTWQVTTVLGAVAGRAIPDDVPLDFAIPLCFLVLLAPAVLDRPTVVAAVVGGAAAVGVAEAGLSDAAIVVGALLGILAGAVVDARISAEDP